MGRSKRVMVGGLESCFMQFHDCDLESGDLDHLVPLSALVIPLSS